jgi:hypothetical protein
MPVYRIFVLNGTGNHQADFSRIVMERPKEKPEKQLKKKRKAPRCLQEAFFLSTAFSLKTAVA